MLWSFLGYAGSAGNLALYDFCCLIRDMFCIGSRWGGGGRGSPRGGGVQYGSMNNSQSSPTSSLPTIFLCCFCSCQTRSKVSYKSMTKWERILCKEPLTIFHLTFFPRKVLGGGVWSCRSLQLTTHIDLVPRLRMSWAIPLRSLHAFFFGVNRTTFNNNESKTILSKSIMIWFSYFIHDTNNSVNIYYLLAHVCHVCIIWCFLMGHI